MVHKTIFGVLLHDRGPFSARHENGVDPNWELQLNPPKWSAWGWLGSPAPMLGVTPNFTGDTSAFYAGLNYEVGLSNHWTDELTLNLTKPIFVGASLSAALHNGPLHKDQSGCKEESDCGFGYRVLPRPSFEVGRYFSSKQGRSIFYDHLSHGDTARRERRDRSHRHPVSFLVRSALTTWLRSLESVVGGIN